ELESRFQITITVNADATIGAAQPFLIEKGEQVHSVEAAKAIAAQAPVPAATVEEEDADAADDIVDEDIDEAETVGDGEQTEEQPAEGQARDGDGQRRGRRRRRSRAGHEGGREPREGEFTHETVAEHAIAHEGDDEGAPAEATAGSEGRPELRAGAEQDGD